MQDDTREIQDRKCTIRPCISIEKVNDILFSRYNIHCENIFELNAYDDRNFWIKLSHDGSKDYVFKVVNEADSKNIEMIETQTKLLCNLTDKKFNCPTPIHTVDGSFFEEHNLDGHIHIVRMFKFVPGIVFDKAPKESQLYYEAGKTIAELNTALQEFDTTIYKNHRFKWMLEEAVMIRKYLYVIQDEKRKNMIEQILIKFEEAVLAHRDSYDIGLIHGDYNEHNIIVQSSPNGQFKVNGVIDFGDAHYSFIIFDLAITMTYMMIHSGSIETGKHVLAGYQSIKNVTDNEKCILSISIQARLCQSLVLGAYSHTLDPENQYLLSSQKHGWKILEELYGMIDDAVLKIWENKNFA